MTGLAPLAGVGVVVVSYGSSSLVERNLEASGLRSAGALVVVVDNWSSPTEREAARALAARHDWVLVESPNVGFGAACDRGAEVAVGAGCDVLVFLNPDARFAAADAGVAASHVRSHPWDLASPTILRPDGSTWFTGQVLDVESARTRRARADDDASLRPWVPGTCLVVGTELWAALDGFGPDYFLYWEDVDLSWRALELGARVVVLPSCTAEHDVGGTQEGVGKSPLYCYWNCRNRLLFAARHLEPVQRRRWAARTPGYAREVVLRSGRRAALLHPGLTLAALRGSVAGLWLLAQASRASRARAAALDTVPPPARGVRS